MQPKLPVTTTAVPSTSGYVLVSKTYFDSKAAAASSEATATAGFSDVKDKSDGVLFIAPSGVPSTLGSPVKGHVERFASALKTGAVGGRLKLPNVKVCVPYSLGFATNGSGVAAGTQSIDPTIVTEASALDTLWSEVKVTGGRFEFLPEGQYFTTPSQFVIAYDPSGNTALTSVANGCQFAQHKLFAVAGDTSGIGLTSTLHECKSLSFPFKVPKGIKVGTTLGGVWSATGTSVSYGYLKVYAIGGNSVTLLQGILYLDLEYSSRQ